MTYSSANTIIDRFLSVFDKFGITSPELGEYNYIPNELLIEYWQHKGVIDVEE